ncbi:MAG TPA: ABC transporter permease [Actinobacteria bacterium]|nr:ABC transporter permease [Actinomycetota bacterium]
MTAPFRIGLEKRLDPPPYVRWLVPILSILVALGFGAVVIGLAGADPIEAYLQILAGAFGSPAAWLDGEFYAVSETIVRTIPLILTGLAVAVAFRMRFWNIGAEGQLVVGGVFVAWVALFLPELLPGIPQTPWVYLPLMAVAAILGGALWALVPAVLKAALEVDEIITTIMLNFVAILTYQYLFTGPWKDPEGQGFPGSAPFPEFAWLPRIGGRVTLGLFLALAAAVVVWLVFDHTKLGYEIALTGENPEAARYAGVRRAGIILAVMLLSGGLAGLAGFTETAGISHRLQQGLAIGNGFTGIIVAWVAKLRPGWIVLVAFLLSALFVGGDQLQISMGLPASIGAFFQGMILLFVLGGDVFSRYRLRIARRAHVISAEG